MQSTVTSKYQTTIPKKIRKNLGLDVHDTLEWKIEGDKVVVTPVHKNFMKFRNSVNTGTGDIRRDLEHARELAVEKYR